MNGASSIPTNGPFFIVCNKRDDPGVTLFMLDRSSKVGLKGNYWTEVLDDSVLKVQVRHIADGIVAKLRFQNPRVLTMAEAQLAFDSNNAFRALDKING
ncbi:hypothetical protein [Stutzerimonas nitrititolerans]|uniref:hypothetical protein n=1 Tax=Stutzerimonas nitrititolerans TaxID=2482751 RepID=UPI0028AD5A74|nr:hypothetical protein [Stutzerimonas nitrititolerans]